MSRVFVRYELASKSSQMLKNIIRIFATVCLIYSLNSLKNSNLCSALTISAARFVHNKTATSRATLSFESCRSSRAVALILVKRYCVRLRWHSETAVEW